MSQLLVRNVPDSLVKKLKRRALERGVSAEEEHRRILREVLSAPAKAADVPYTMFDHFRKLGEIAPDIEINPMRKRWKMRKFKC
jgi:plasmid stability protein